MAPKLLAGTGKHVPAKSKSGNNTRDNKKRNYFGQRSRNTKNTFGGDVSPPKVGVENANILVKVLICKNTFVPAES